MREIKAIEYTCGSSAVVAGLGLYSYQVRELLAALVLVHRGFFLSGSGGTRSVPGLVRKREGGDLDWTRVA